MPRMMLLHDLFFLSHSKILPWLDLLAQLFEDQKNMLCIFHHTDSVMAHGAKNPYNNYDHGYRDNCLWQYNLYPPWCSLSPNHFSLDFSQSDFFFEH